MVMQYLFNPWYINQLYINRKKAIECYRMIQQIFKVCGSQSDIKSCLFISAKHFTKNFFKYLKCKKLSLNLFSLKFISSGQNCVMVSQFMMTNRHFVVWSVFLPNVPLKDWFFCTNGSSGLTKEASRLRSLFLCSVFSYFNAFQKIWKLFLISS